ncbi:MAG: GNAT family N-acetyltransferase [Planctomycetes bacterium]|nr:GNAT family N-acetyltransferase [Planctomycetota bacterium]
MPGKIILTTGRLILREFDEDDAAAFLILGSDPAITRYTGDGGLRDVAQAREELRTRPLADYRQHGFGRWACVDRDSDDVIGFAGLKYLDELREVDIGYRLLPSYWGKGLATEAGRAIIDYGFEQLHLTQIIGLVEPDNIASIRVLQKLGLTHTGPIIYRSQTVNRYLLKTNTEH